MNFNSPEFLYRAESEMEDSTRLSSVAHADADHVDATRIAHTPVLGSDMTRLASDARSVDLEAEGTRIYCAPAVAIHEIDERYEIGDRIGDRYEVLAIHCGAMGVVYGSFDHEEQLPRALKTLRRRFSDDSGMRALFVAEATTWVKLGSHPFIVRAYLVEEFDDEPYVITEYIRGHETMGGDLRAWLGHPKLTLAIAIEMALQIAQGMQHACRKVPGLIHRDLKPANILVDERARAMVTDFGLVEAEGSGAGTPAFMAPEQWREGPLDARTDIYAYGCILYEIFTGHRMYAADSEAEWKSAHLTQIPIVPVTLNPNLPSKISDFIGRCLAKRCEHRPSNWDEVVFECARWFHDVTGQPVVLDFSDEVVSEDELLKASYSLGTLKKYPEMLNVCDRLLARDSNNGAAWNNKGIALKSLKRYGEALLAYDQALTIDPGDVAAWSNKSSTLNALGRHEEALAACNQALAIDPNDAFAWLRKSVALHNLNRKEEADFAFGLHQLAECEQKLSINPLSPNNWDTKGDALIKLNRREEALIAFNQALTLNPTYEPAWRNKRRALESLGRHEEAVASCDRELAAYNSALTIDPSNTIVLINLGDALEVLDRHEEALGAYDRAIAIYPNHKRYQEALFDATDEAVPYPGYADALRNKCNLLVSLTRYDEALMAYDQLIAYDPDNKYAWEEKGCALECLNRHDEAILAFDKALMIDPDLETTWYQKGKVLASLARHEEAIEAYDSALGCIKRESDEWCTDPNSTTAIDTYISSWVNKAIALDYLNRHEQALAAYKHALAFSEEPNHASSWSCRAKALVALGRYEEAIDAYDRALALDPQNQIILSEKTDTLANLRSVP